MKTLFPFLMFVTICCKAQSVSIDHTLYFESGKSDLSPKELRYLDSLAILLKTTETYSIDIKAYCDNVGTDESNRELAKDRATAVNDIFINENLQTKSIRLNSFGENDPIADNSTEVGKAKNRRAEISFSYEPKKQKAALASEIKPVIEEPAKNIEFKGAKLEVGKTLVLKNINFEGGTDEFLPASEPTLKELLLLMQKNPKLEIEIGGHVCCANDMPLSLTRARRVFEYLSYFGINEKRMTYKGYSRSKPLTEERNEQERTMNRRVEITVMKL